MNSKTRVILTVTLVAALTLGLVTGGCFSDESSSGGPALGRITDLSTEPGQSPQVSKAAPDFQFEDPDGQATSLSELWGSPVMLNFWATWCGPCRYEMPFIQQVYDEWSGKGLMILAIDLGESASTVKGFLRSNGYSFPVLLDTKGSVGGQYNVRGIPTTFLIDKDGIIQGIKIGAFQNKEEIEASIRMVIE